MSLVLTFLKSRELFNWDPKLETGIDIIDTQHKYIFETARKLVDAAATEKSKMATVKALDFLTDYVVQHFRDEEKLQAQYKYPNFVEHRRKHDEFKDRVVAFSEKVNKDGIVNHVMDELCTIVSAWLYSHIKGDDFRLAAFIKAANAKAKENPKV